MSLECCSYTLLLLQKAGSLCCLHTSTSAGIMAEHNSLEPWLTLVHTKGLGPGLLRKLQEGLGSVDEILGTSDSKLICMCAVMPMCSALRSLPLWAPASLATALKTTHLTLPDNWRVMALQSPAG